MGYFNDISAVFLRNIYRRPKGAVRLAVLRRDLSAILPPRPWSVLDIGGGAGQMALWLAAQGHRVTVVDVAENLLAEGRRQAVALGLADQVEFVAGDIFQRPPAPHDLLLCHAVLEWLPQQRELLKLCCDNLRPGGWLSLMFYNRSAFEFAQYVFGNFDYLDRNYERSSAKLTPQFPCNSAEIAAILQDLTLKIEKISNVRCFYDYMKPRDRERHRPEELVRRELVLADRAEFRAVARYLHYLVQK